MTGRRSWAVVAVVALIAFIAGASGAALVLMGPMRYRAPGTAALVAATPTSRTITSPVPIGTPAPPPQGQPSPSFSGPRPRLYATWVFDAESGNFLMFGGEYATGSYHEFEQPLSDTWTFNGSKWSQAQPTGAVPAARFNSSMCFDSIHKVVVVHGGNDQSNTWHYNDTWTWDGSTWKLLSPDQQPPAYGSQPMAWDSAVNAAFAFVWTGQGSLQPVDQTWLWNGTSWNQVGSAGAPSGHNGPEGVMAYDPGRRVIVYFDHVNGQPATWIFNGMTWSQAPTSSGSDSQHFTMAENDAQSNVVLFGENGDTWSWDGSKWTSQNPAHSPSGRRGASMTYDSAHGVDVLFGGGSGQLAAYKEYNDVWTWNGSDWNQVSASA